MEDEHLRSACFASLDVLSAQWGEDVPYLGGLDQGFPVGGQRVPFLSTQKGIFRAAVQQGPAALSVQTSWRSPYGDTEVSDGFLYAYRDGPLDQPDNRALRAAFTLLCRSCISGRRGPADTSRFTPATSSLTIQ